MLYPIDRFLKAHKRDYSIALEEIGNGKKRSHWMWYIFPQLRGLGYSDYAEYYGLEGLEETTLFLSNEYLSNNLKEIVGVLLSLELSNADEIFGYTDSMKLKSSMTLFYIATGDALYKSVLDKFFNGEMCPLTKEMVGK